MKVFTYTPAQHHCREGVAVEQRDVLIDTFWGSMGQDSHRLTADERESAAFLFDTDDYDELPWYERTTPDVWSRYAPTDRKTIPSQHGLQHLWFIRKGASPDLDTQIRNAEEALDDAESAVRMAQGRRDYAASRLRDLIALREIPAPKGTNE